MDLGVHLGNRPDLGNEHLVEVEDVRRGRGANQRHRLLDSVVGDDVVCGSVDQVAVHRLARVVDIHAVIDRRETAFVDADALLWPLFSLHGSGGRSRRDWQRTQRERCRSAGSHGSTRRIGSLLVVIAGVADPVLERNTSTLLQNMSDLMADERRGRVGGQDDVVPGGERLGAHLAGGRCRVTADVGLDVVDSMGRKGFSQSRQHRRRLSGRAGALSREQSYSRAADVRAVLSARRKDCDV